MTPLTVIEGLRWSAPSKSGEAEPGEAEPGQAEPGEAEPLELGAR